MAVSTVNSVSLISKDTCGRFCAKTDATTSTTARLRASVSRTGCPRKFLRISGIDRCARSSVRTGQFAVKPTGMEMSNCCDSGRLPSFARHGSFDFAPGRLARAPVPTRALLPPQKVLGDEQHVRWALGQPPHEVGIPLGAERDVDAHAPAIFDQALLQVAPDAVQHLKFKSVARNVLTRGKGLGFFNNGLVMGG